MQLLCRNSTADYIIVLGSRSVARVRCAFFTYFAPSNYHWGELIVDGEW